MKFSESYLGSLRAVVGSKPLLVPGARVFILNDRNEVLFIKRADFDLWGLVGGAAELGESIVDCAKRESLEEANVEVETLECWGISTDFEEERVEYPNGDIIHGYSVMLYTRQWQGNPKPDLLESKEVAFFSLDNLPELHPNTLRAVKRFQEFLQSKSFFIK